jgi:hypothetical protein
MLMGRPILPTPANSHMLTREEAERMQRKLARERLGIWKMPNGKHEAVPDGTHTVIPGSAEAR